jgi:hypothetical protein
MHLPQQVVTPQGAARLQRRLTSRRCPARLPGKGGDHLTITFSVLLVFGAGVIVLCRFAGLRVLHALVCVLFGFYLASSSAAPDIDRIVASLIHSLN